MMRAGTVFLLVGLAIFTFSCKQTFKPEVTSTNINLLVVEGVINIGADSTIIKLSRTVLVDNKTTAKPETGATVVVESETNEKYPLLEKTPGRYIAPALNLNSTKKYRISISKSGNNYVSDFVRGKITPAIDSVNYTVENNGVQLYVNTHDDTNSSIYYRYEYVETWLFHPLYLSVLVSDGRRLLDRDMVNQNIYNCWQSYNSSTIVLASTTKLNKDVVHLNPVTFVKSDSEKIMDKYSIIVKQYAIGKEEFEFWELLKKNTESLGSIFDAQPSQLTGNVRNSAKPEEPVIGFVSVGTAQSKRIFISKTKLPNWPTTYPYKCAIDTVPVVDKSGGRPQDAMFHTFRFVPLSYVGDGPVALGGSRECADCTVRGINKAPDFWQ